RLAGDRDHLLDGEAVFLREREIPLVMTRYPHHRAFTIRHQNVVADPDLDLLSRDGMRDEKARADAFLLHGRELGLDHGAVPAFLDEGRDLAARSRRVRREWMFGGNRTERDTHDRVGARCEDPHLAIADERAARTSDIVRERKTHAFAA